MPRLGIVDLGSNTARLVVFAYEAGQWFRLVDQIRQPVRLGEGLGRDGNLTPAAQDRTARALRLYADYAQSTGLPPLLVFGTSAIRDAGNRQEFLDRVRHLGLEITVLDGPEEAGLGVLAVGNGFRFHDAWVVDLGGGSAQVSLMQERQFVKGQSLPLGAVRLTESFLSSDPPKRKEIGRLESSLEHHLQTTVEEIVADDLPLIAMGGTVRNLAQAIQKKERYPLPDRIHGYFLSRESLDRLVDRLLARKARKRGRIPGIKLDRADVIVAGALVFRWLLSQTGRRGLWISGLGLREGALMRRFLPAPHLIEDLRLFTVQNLLQHYTQSKEHVELTSRLSARLFAGLQPIHGFTAGESELLEAAAVLQDIGLAVNYHRHDRHGAYLVSAAPLMGFTHREQALLALLVRFHLQGRPRLGVYRSLCDADDTKLLEALVACLRLADHLDRPRAQRVEDLEVDLDDSTIVVRPIASRDLSLELWQIEQHRALFRLAFDRELVVEPLIVGRLQRSSLPAGAIS